MFLVVGVSMIIDLVCCVTKITMSVSRTVCHGHGVWRTSLYKCVCVRVCVNFLWYQSCFAYNYYPYSLLFFIHEIRSTSWSRHQTLSGISHSIG